jgi:NAD(P)-dependent dehydrogenase (short-subunit alcohol dehydrogenase family)
MSDRLSGKIALITGGVAGVGIATAKPFVAEGAVVFIIGRCKPSLTPQWSGTECVIAGPDKLHRSLEYVRGAAGAAR